jgi:hypothetical protein
MTVVAPPVSKTKPASTPDLPPFHRTSHFEGVLGQQHKREGRCELAQPIRPMGSSASLAAASAVRYAAWAGGALLRLCHPGSQRVPDGMGRTR